MNYIQTEIDGVWLIEPKVFADARGYFMETFKEEEFRQQIGDVHFVQDNESKSTFGVLRGLHYQKGEFSQAKNGSSASVMKRCSPIRLTIIMPLRLKHPSVSMTRSWALTGR